MKIVGDTWFNSKPLVESDLKGKNVLVIFWAYSNANSLKALSHVQKWYETYKDKGMIFLSIHSPEFEFEKVPENVEQAIRDLKITWPVVLDNEYENWKKFRNRYWPAQYLVNRGGDIVYIHHREGDYEEIENEIQKLLKTYDKDLKFPDIVLKQKEQPTVSCSLTPELFCGYELGRVSGGYLYDKKNTYRSPRSLKGDSIALEGEFLAKADYLESASMGAKMFINFRATEINIVMKPVKEKAVVGVFFNEEPLLKGMRGDDVNDHGEVVVDRPQVYNIFKSSSKQNGIFTIKAKEKKFQAFALTFF